MSVHSIRIPLAVAVLAVGLAACGRPDADLILYDARAYTLAWGDPAPDGTPSPAAPYGPAGWHPDASAVAVRGGTILFVGSDSAALRYRGPATKVIDLHGATLLPGLVDAHVHIENLGAKLERVDLSGAANEADAVERVVAWARHVPKGQWIVGWGWDDGAWANRYPDMRLLTRRVPDNPVYLAGLHGYAAWGNALAFERAGITAATPAPEGGEIRKGRDGRPTGIVLNRAVDLLARAVPAPTPAQLEQRVLRALQTMAGAGYVMVSQAGADRGLMTVFDSLDVQGRLPIRMYAMVEARDTALSREWIARGPRLDPRGWLTVRAIKAFADGALGSRGARLLADYADAPGQRGVSQTFDHGLVADAMDAGFQAAIHAIGDAANREALDFFDSVFAAHSATRALRSRIEHAQVLAPADVPRFARSGIVASMQPPHAVEDMGWAEQRLGPERVRGAYAWRSLRRAGARLVFSSDLPGTDYSIFYGLHSAITRRSPALQPPGGWYPDQDMTPEEAVRGYTSWAAWAQGFEDRAGVLERGRWADLTAMDVDPFVMGRTAPDSLLGGKIVLTVVAGRVVFQAPR